MVVGDGDLDDALERLARVAFGSLPDSLEHLVHLEEDPFPPEHEVLEAVWKTAKGDTRQALQGVIQIAVAYHHLSHGNSRGARTLMTEGRGRLERVPSSVLWPLDVGALLDATAPWATALVGRRPTPPAHPLLALAG